MVTLLFFHVSCMEILTTIVRDFSCFRDILLSQRCWNVIIVLHVDMLINSPIESPMTVITIAS